MKENISLYRPAAAFITIVANPLWGSVYDLTGGYAPALMLVPLLLLCAAGLLHILLKGKR